MGFIDFLLDLAALLLWLTWRSMRFDRLPRSTPATLAGTIKPAEPRQMQGWPFLLSLGLLLILRAFVYREISSPADWTPKLDLNWVVLAFRTNRPAPVLLFSVLSFLRVLIVFQFWLLFLTVVNQESVEPDRIQRIIRQQTAPLVRLPWLLRLLVPVVLCAGLWMAIHPLLVTLNVSESPRSTARLLEQGLLIGSGLFFTLKFLLPIFLLLHLVASYVYLGKNVFWDFVSTTARNLLAPLRMFPLRFARIDFAPVAAVSLIFLLLHWLPNLIVAALAKRALGVWPQ
jgi:uncharacterized protein YggT (Ycf19 family)